MLVGPFLFPIAQYTALALYCDFLIVIINIVVVSVCILGGNRVHHVIIITEKSINKREFIRSVFYGIIVVSCVMTARESCVYYYK